MSPPQPIAENYTCPMTSGLSLLCNSRKEFAVLPSRDGAFQDIRRHDRADDLQARGAAHVADRIQRQGAVGCCIGQEQGAGADTREEGHEAAAEVDPRRAARGETACLPSPPSAGLSWWSNR